METFREGFLIKNHAGREFKEAHNKRWFETKGFHVKYFKERDKKSLKGHFDLRNVQGIQEFQHDNERQLKSAGKGAIMMKIVEQGKKGQQLSDKVMIISFKDLPVEEKDAWLRLWCSAIDEKHVNEHLKIHYDRGLAAALNSQFSETSALSRSRSVLKREATVTKVLTPRQAASLEEVQTVVETPRDSPRPPEPSSPSVPAATAENPVTAELPPADPPLPAAAASPASAPPLQQDAVAPPDASALAPTPAVEDTTFEITVPEGVSPGDRLQATTPSGVKVKLVVPQGAEAGMLLTFQVPKVDGKKRKKRAEGEADGAKAEDKVLDTPEKLAEKPAEKPAENGAPKEEAVVAPMEEAVAVEEAAADPSLPPTVPKPAMVEDEAATKLQSSFRGLKTRDSQQEAARLQWFNYYMQPEVADFAEAEKMAITDEELAKVADAARGKPAQKAAVDPDEQRRLEWFKHYIHNKQFDKADEIVSSDIVVSKVEKAQIVKAKAMVASQCCSCLPNKGAIESDRQERFVLAVKEYDWDVAEILAISPDEVQDVADSKMRVNQLDDAIHRRDFDLALQYAITKEEEGRVSKAKAKASEMTKGDAALKEELRRVEWLKYYQGQGDLKKAKDLAVTPEEIAEIEKEEAKAQAPPAAPPPAPPAPPALTTIADPDDREALRRVMPLEARADADSGEPVAVSHSKAAIEREEDDTARDRSIEDELLSVQRTADVPEGSKDVPEGSNEAPKEPSQGEAAEGGENADTFEASVMRYDWESASKLAVTPADHQDLADSKARVEWLKTYIEQGEYEKAQGLAITEAEMAEIQAAAPPAAPA